MMIVDFESTVPEATALEAVVVHWLTTYLPGLAPTKSPLIFLRCYTFY